MRSISIKPDFDGSFQDFIEIVNAASKFNLPEAVLKRLLNLGESIGNFIVHGDLRAAARTDEFYFPLCLKFSDLDTVFLTALRTGNIGSIGHVNVPSVGAQSTDTLPTPEVN
jgi:hypothetical protein